MEIGHAYDYFRIQVKPVLQSKLEEFQLLGYSEISEDEFWGFLIGKKWRKTKSEMKLYEIVEEIMAVKVGEYINYATIESYKDTDFSFDNEEVRKEFLK